MIFLDGEGSQLTNLISLIHYFKLVSGMRINCQKSCFVGLNTPPHNLLGIAEALKCPIRSFPVDYLGVPLGGNPAKKEFWFPVIERYQRNLPLGKLNSYPLVVVSPSSKKPYRTSLYLSIFKIPIGVAREIETTKKFLMERQL